MGRSAKQANYFVLYKAAAFDQLARRHGVLCLRRRRRFDAAKPPFASTDEAHVTAHSQVETGDGATPFTRMTLSRMTLDLTTVNAQQKT